jgi:hypothetical protein
MAILLVTPFATRRLASQFQLGLFLGPNLDGGLSAPKQDKNK